MILRRECSRPTRTIEYNQPGVSQSYWREYVTALKSIVRLSLRMPKTRNWDRQTCECRVNVKECPERATCKPQTVSRAGGMRTHQSVARGKSVRHRLIRIAEARAARATAANLSMFRLPMVSSSSPRDFMVITSCMVRPPHAICLGLDAAVTVVHSSRTQSKVLPIFPSHGVEQSQGLRGIVGPSWRRSKRSSPHENPGGGHSPPCPKAGQALRQPQGIRHAGLSRTRKGIGKNTLRRHYEQGRTGYFGLDGGGRGNRFGGGRRAVTCLPVMTKSRLGRLSDQQRRQPCLWTAACF